MFSPEPRFICFFFHKSSTLGIKRVCLSWSLPLSILNSSTEKHREHEISRETSLELGRAQESLSMTAWGSEFKWYVWAGTVQSKVVKEIKNLQSATHSECCGPPFPSCCSSPGNVSLIKSQRSICPLIVSNWLSYTIYFRLYSSSLGQTATSWVHSVYTSVESSLPLDVSTPRLLLLSQPQPPPYSPWDSACPGLQSDQILLLLITPVSA